MYAVVRTGGKQLKVEPETIALIEKIDAPLGESVTLPAVFFSDGDRVVADAAGLASITVTAEVVEQIRDDKVVVFKFKKRKGYKRTRGHRQSLTRVRITDISTGVDRPKKSAKAAVEAEEGAAKVAAEVKPKAQTAAKAAEKKPAAKKPAASTAAAKAKPAAKKAATPKAVAEKKPAAKTGEKKPAAKAESAKPKAQAAPKSAAKKPAEKKTAAKKPAEKKTAAKKPAAKKPADTAE